MEKPIREYVVVWVCDIAADSPREAAELAESIMTAPDAMRPWLEVRDAETDVVYEIDLAVLDS
jgi:hypothetical protein